MSLRWAVVGLAVSSLAMVLNVAAFVGNVVSLPEAPVLQPLLATLQIGLAVLMAGLVRRSWRRIVAARAVRRMDVRVLRDGAELPCELVCLGVDPQGVTVWAVVDPAIRDGDQLCAAVLPPMTALLWAGMEPLGPWGEQS